MRKTKTEETRNLIVEGMKIAAQKFISAKKKSGQKIVTSENGIIKVIEAKDIKP